jgi:hypothetical protein
MSEHLNDPGMEDALRALHVLRESSLAVHASDGVETALRQAFRTQYRTAVPLKSSRPSGWIVGAIAASVAIAVLVRLSQTPVVSAPKQAVVATATAAPAVAEVRNEPKPAPARAKRAPRARRPEPVVTANAPEKRELVTDFFAIPYAPAMTQVDRGQLIRVNVPAMSMRSFGLPVREERLFDRVQADVLMGEDGLARAIRFVRQQNSGLNYR